MLRPHLGAGEEVLGAAILPPQHTLPRLIVSNTPTGAPLPVESSKAKTIRRIQNFDKGTPRQVSAAPSASFHQMVCKETELEGKKGVGTVAVDTTKEELLACMKVPLPMDSDDEAYMEKEWGVKPTRKVQRQTAAKKEKATTTKEKCKPVPHMTESGVLVDYGCEYPT